MPYEVLARKWRPQVFEDVIGQEHVTETLKNALTTSRLAHAYLFSGPRGVGKTSVARIFAKAINCDQGPPEVPCNRCAICSEITDGSAVDVQEIDGASNRGIDEIRELRENIRYMPSACRYRIYIIDEVHMLTLQAFNALLKTLEEPPEHVKFIFATTEAHKVPVTILSRCQRYDFKRIPINLIVDHMAAIAKAEGIDISRPGLAVIAGEAEGSMRDVQSLLDQVISFAGQKVTEKDIIQTLGIIDRDILFESSAAIIDGAPDRCLDVVDKIYTYGYDIKDFYRTLMQQFRNLLISLIAPEDHLIDMTRSDLEKLHRQADKAGEERLHFLLNYMINREEDLRFTSHPRLILEATMVKLARTGDLLSFEKILNKLENLEKRILSSMPHEASAANERLSDPQGNWGRDAQKSETESFLPTPEDEDRSWEGFLSFVSEKNKVVYSVLKEWECRRLEENVLEIKSGTHAFSSSYFDDPQHYDQLTAYGREFFDRNIRIRMIPGDSNAKAPLPEPRPDKHKPLSNPDLPPTVHQVVEMFEGRIVDPNGAGGKRP
ncbi:MAG: DNA polymerase III subunit gamma/tau [Deltaproteobacteria bacterium]|nr:DNA polymerase III subunit gamma/tau [Deltaproteobacteria bacterium]